MKRFASVALLVAASCVPTPPSPPLDYGTSPEGVCAHLDELGCPEAKPARDGTSCPDVVRKMQRIVDPKLSCLASAPDVVSVRACGTVRCLQ